MGKLVFSETGIQVHLPDPSNDVDFHTRGVNDYGGLGQRVPLLYDERTRQAYVGAPAWYHGDVRQHHKLSEGYEEGYFNGDQTWGNGNLEWYMEPPKDHADLITALNQAGMNVPVAPPQSKYAPTNPQPDSQAEEEALWEDDEPMPGHQGTGPDLDYWHP